MSSKQTDEEQVFQLAVRRAALELLEDSAMAGQGHPDIDELVAYLENRLAAAEAERIRAHTERCAECRKEVEELVNLELDVSDDPDLVPGPEMAAEDWEVFQERLRRKTEQEGSGNSSSELRGRSMSATPLWGRPWGMGLLAASLLMGIVGATAWLSGGWGLWRAGSDAPPSEAYFKRPFLLDLIPDGEQLQRSAETQVVIPPPDTDLLVFRLLLGDLTIHPSYRAEIRGGDGQLVWSQEQLVRQPMGAFVVLVSNSLLSPGSYQLKLEAGDPGDERTLATYSFEISSRD